eukprot:8176827-Pyramimonas_sp.AAC.1
MDIVDGEPPGKLRWIGKVCREGEYVFVPDQESVDQCQVLKMCEELFQAVSPKAHGVLFGTSLRRIPHISQALWAVILRWNRRDRTDYHIK